MRALLDFFERASAWMIERAASRSRPSPRGRTNRALVLCGLVVGLMMGSVTTAQAQTRSWDFTYSGSGISASGTFTAVLNLQDGVWDMISLSGQRNGVLIGAPCADPFLSCAALISGRYVNVPGGEFGTNFGAPGEFGAFYYHTVEGDAYNVVGGAVAREELIDPCCGLEGGTFFSLTVLSTETVSVSYSPHPVPEINASAGLAALVVLFGFALIMREMFLRRRRLIAI